MDFPRLTSDGGIPMHKVGTWFLAGTLGLGLAGQVRAAKNDKGSLEESITIAEVPSAARATLEREAQGGALEQLRKETGRDGTVVYQADVIKNGKETKLQVDAAGKLLEPSNPKSGRSEHQRQTK
jgi:hypothetical protein